MRNDQSDCVSAAVTAHRSEMKEYRALPSAHICCCVVVLIVVVVVEVNFVDFVVVAVDGVTVAAKPASA